VQIGVRPPPGAQVPGFFLGDAAMTAQRRMGMPMKVALVLAVLLVIAANLLMVLPGYYLFLAGDLPFGRHMAPFHGDNWLPVAMQMQLLWAPVLPAGWWVAQRRFGPGGQVKSLALAAALAAAWAVVLATLLHWHALST
jgi:hypothetical protein